jgi:hypothetical protein
VHKRIFVFVAFFSHVVLAEFLVDITQLVPACRVPHTTFEDVMMLWAIIRITERDHQQSTPATVTLKQARHGGDFDPSTPLLLLSRDFTKIPAAAQCNFTKIPAAAQCDFTKIPAATQCDFTNVPDEQQYSIEPPFILESPSDSEQALW